MATAASACATVESLTCPVCHKNFSHPKILPCTHLVCRHCLLTHLKEPTTRLCPLCRTAILPPESQGQLDLDLFVDDLATDLVTMTLVEDEKTLKEDDVCVCDSNAMATTFCLQCSVKLCAVCSKAHKRLPATHKHQLEQLTSMTPDKMLTMCHRGSPCHAHPQEPSDLFCASHQHLICIICSSSTHRQCQHVRTVREAASLKREELKDLMERLKEKTNKIDEEIQTQEKKSTSAEANIQAAQEQIQTTFDDLQQALETRRQELVRRLQERVDRQQQRKSNLQCQLEQQRCLTAAHSSLAERLVSVGDECLLTMCEKLQPRLQEVETQEVCDVKETFGEIAFDLQASLELKEKIAELGCLDLCCPAEITGGACPACQQPACHGHQCAKRTRLRRQDSIPCPHCASEVAALDNGDMYMCPECSRVRMACEICGWTVTVRNSQGVDIQLSACPQCGH